MRHNSPVSIGKTVGAVVEAPPGPGEGDFLQRVNTTITNFKELGKIFMQFRRENEGEELPAEPTPRTPANPQPRAPGLVDYIQLAIKAGYGDNFGHGLGHGLGLAIHEAPRLGPGAETVLTDGKVFTIEPGIYLPGWGGVRIEDTVVMECGRIRVLSQAGK